MSSTINKCKYKINNLKCQSSAILLEMALTFEFINIARFNLILVREVLNVNNLDINFEQGINTDVPWEF